MEISKQIKNSDLTTDTRELRKIHADIRKNMSRSEVDKLSDRVCKRLEELVRDGGVFESDTRFYLYYPLGNEVDVLGLADILWKNKCETAFPRTISKQAGDTDTSESMDFYKVNGIQDFKEGRYHILEPVGERPVYWEDAIVIVPGVMFDEHGNRVGHGKGYYDRYFSEHKVKALVGAAYENQLEKCLKAEQWDIPMDYIVTEDRLITTLCRQK